MGVVIVTLKIMPDSPDTDLSSIGEKAKKMIADFGGTVGKVEIIPVAFGLKSIQIMFSMREEKGDAEPVEKEISQLEGVTSAEVVDVRRAIG